METNTNIRQKRCVYCGQFFKPDRRVGARQKSCQERGCQKRRKRESQKRWVEANPGYFQGQLQLIACMAPVNKEDCDFMEGVFHPGDMSCDTEEKCEAPTVIRLSSFNVTQQDGQNLIVWFTGTEIDTEGFHILRSTKKDGHYQKITNPAIPYLGTTTNNHVFHYTYTDMKVEKGKNYYYRLEIIEKDVTAKVQ